MSCELGIWRFLITTLLQNQGSSAKLNCANRCGRAGRSAMAAVHADEY